MDLSYFFKEHKIGEWGSEKEKQTKLRIDISICAYAYEFENDSLISDDDFDAYSKLIDPFVDTNNKIMDNFFLNEFDECTGQWIHKHPQLDGIKKLYKTYHEL